jgi:glycosyltransferase involved in cell wall biosynthesis
MTKDGKINILCIPSDHFGCGYWRSVHPHSYLALNMPDKFNVDLAYDIPTSGILKNFFQQYDIVHSHKRLGSKEMLKFIQDCGCMVCIDVDDSPKLDWQHPMYLTSKVEKWYEPINEALKMANFVTTTTPIFANEIKHSLNKNTFVLPNALPENEGQFILHKKKETDRMRFGLVCGSSHLHDILILKDMIEKFPSEYWNKVQFCLCGFDVRGTTTTYKPPTEPGGKPTSTQRPIRPEESVWNEFERILTNNYQTISEEHKKFLLSYMANVDDPFTDEPYRRFWTKPIENYYSQYNNIDVLMAPLCESHFNSVKSNLKFVESCFAHVPIIATDFGPYSYDRKPVITKGMKINPDGNCFLVETRKNNKDWLRTVKWIIDNPDSLQWVSNNLYYDYKDRYSAKAVAEKRAKIYEEVVNNKEKYKK